MSGGKRQFLFTILLVLLVFGLGTRIVNAEEQKGGEEDRDAVREKIEEAILSEFDFDEIERSLQEMFPDEKIEFGDVVTALMSGDAEEAGGVLLDFLSDVVSYEFRYNWHNLVYILLIAIAAAVFSNFSGAFRNRQISDISFYVLYMLLITLCLTSFQTAAQGLEERLDSVVEFMRVLCRDPFAHLCGGACDHPVRAAGHPHLYHDPRPGQSDGGGFSVRVRRADAQGGGVDPEDTAGVCDRGKCRTGAPGSCHRYAEKKRAYQDCRSAALGGKCDGRSRGDLFGDSGPDQERHRDGRGSHRSPHLSRSDRTAGADGIDV